VTTFRVIESGRALSSGDAIDMHEQPIEPPSSNVLERVRAAEKDLYRAAELMAPATVIVDTPKIDLAWLVACGDFADAVQTLATFKDTVAAVDPLFRLLRAAERRLAAVINELAAARGGPP
jgi:hypothetical protein